MKKLKRQLIRFFIVITIAVATTESALNYLVDEHILPAVEKNGTYLTLVLMADFIGSFLVLLGFAYLFCRYVSRKVDEVAKAQIMEKNLLYSNLVHDLKTPMTSILGFAKALKDHRVDEEEKEQSVEIIYQKSKQMDELINMLFCYSKLETEGYELNLCEYDICTLMREVVAECYDEFESRAMELELEIPDTPIVCKIDVNQFRRAVQNLLTNAYKHNKNGTKVVIMVQRLDSKAQILIADTGVRIPEELKKSMFDSFVCGNESRTSKDGSGLGLAITKRIVEKHGGNVFLKEQIDEYTKAFVIELKVSYTKNDYNSF